MFWRKKKKTMDKKFKKQLLEELDKIRNDTILLLREVERLSKKLKEEKI